MVDFFIPAHKQSLLERQKSRALVWFMYTLFLLLFLLILVSVYPEPNFSISDYGLPIGQIFVISVLFVLKKYGLRRAGDTFSLGGLLIITIVINIFDQDTLFTKYGEEYFIAILVLVFISLFGTRRILVFSVIVIFLSSIRAFFFLIDTYPKQTNMLIEAQVFFSVCLVTISIILYYATKFADEALSNAQKDAEIKEEQNKALSIAQKRAEKSELLYRSIVKNLIGGFFKTNRKEHIEMVSPSVMGITGFPEENIAGNTLASLFVNIEERNVFFKKIKKAGKIELYKAEFKTRNRGNIYIEMNARMVYDSNGEREGIEGIFYDITEQRKMEIELEKHRNNLELLVQEKTDEIEASNEELLATNEELMSQNKEVLKQKDLIDKQNIELKKFQDQLKVANLTLEEKVKVRTRELEASNRTLAKAVNELDRFVYSASHDLGAPLKSIMGLVNIAKLEDKDNILEVHLKYIEESIIKQENVINSLIQFSKNERQEIVKESINLHALINQIFEELRYMPGSDDIAMINKLSKEQIVLIDKQRMKMILINLLSNGIKYRDPVRNDSFVKIEFEELKNSWYLIVEDNGHGIARDQQTKIFDMFYRANLESDGSGLGLFIVHEAVERMGGAITVKSTLGKGSTFTMEFPLISPV